MPQDQSTLLAVHSVDHFVMTVPDLAEAKNYFELLGLEVKQEGDTLGLYCFGNLHRAGVLNQGAPKKLSGLCFGCFEADLPRFKSHLESLNIPFNEGDNSLNLVDPAGFAIEIKVAERSSNTQIAPFNADGGNTGNRASPLRSECPKTQPSRFAHIAMFTGDLSTSLEFYQQALGLGLSDRSLDIVGFLHSPHGSDHHIFALLGGEGPGLHHTSWEVSSINQVGVAATHMALNGYAYGWGLGRHVLGSNYFHYVRDPWGSWSEYSGGMDYVPEGAKWPGENHGPEDSFYLWGPDVPEGFTDNVEQKG